MKSIFFISLFIALILFSNSLLKAQIDNKDTDNLTVPSCVMQTDAKYSQLLSDVSVLKQNIKTAGFHYKIARKHSLTGTLTFIGTQLLSTILLIRSANNTKGGEEPSLEGVYLLGIGGLSVSVGFFISSASHTKKMNNNLFFGSDKMP